MKLLTKMAFAVMLAVIMLPGGAAQAHNELTVINAAGSKTVLFYKDLVKLPVTEIETNTPWTAGKHVFKGVLFADLFKKFGITEEEVLVSALNDYSVTIPVSELTENGAILAYQLDGKTMSIREKGPYWVIFPFDRDPSFQTDRYWSYAVWQVKLIDAQP
ncbi:hypothetical protein TMES_01660 [Thalassospira mesophila]|uniref:Oxidoreductase molybdopterin-binding domain-containing protein n=1 Tax=Thalassospira mesophila TaxID=1293891 RepID=A0A1Y2L718_9PROT|nr:hypothetical protein TMES_01660 [Thalassospira mesophila]